MDEGPKIIDIIGHRFQIGLAQQSRCDTLGLRILSGSVDVEISVSKKDVNTPVLAKVRFSTVLGNKLARQSSSASAV